MLNREHYNNKDISVGDYIRGYEKVGLNTIREMRGWVMYRLENKNSVVGYHVQCDDTWNGNRSSDLLFTYGKIVKEYTDRKPNNEVNSY